MRRLNLPRPMLGSLLHVLLLCLVTASSADLVPSFLKEPQSTVAQEGGSVTLNCEVTPSTASVEWTFKGHYLSSDRVAGYVVDNNSLQIRSFTKDRHEGLYYCVAGTSAGTIRSDAAVVSSPWLREFSSSYGNIYVKVTLGNTAVLPCQPPESNPKAKVLFNFNNTVIGGGDRHKILSSGNLHIGRVQASDQGVYRCIAVNPVSGHNSSAPNTISLLVIEAKSSFPPVVISNDTEVTALTGSSLLLECAGLGNPPPKIQWKKYGGFLREDRTERILGNLLIKSIEVRDQGTYICSAKNNLGHPPGKLFRVGVKAPPVVHINNPNLVVYEGESVDVECEIGLLAKESRPKLEWLHNAKDIPDSAVIDGSTLNIPSVKVSHAGLYQCIASGNSGRASAVARLEVRPGSRSSPEKPEKDQPDSSSSNQPIGEPTDKSPAPLPETKPSKGKGNKDKNPGNGVRHSGRNRKKNHKKKNKHRKKGRNGKGQAKLVPPSKPTVSKLGESSVQLNWTVPTNDGLQITFFRVQYKELKPFKSTWETIDEDIGKLERKYEVRRLKHGGTYKFRIAAVYTNNDNTVGANSRRFTLARKSKTVTRPMLAPVIVEVQPFNPQESINVNIQPPSSYALAVRWQYKGTDDMNVAGFSLEYKPYASTDDYKVLLLLAPKLRHHILKDLKPATEYSIRIKAFNKAGNGDYSNTVVKKTLGNDEREIPFKPIFQPDKPDDIDPQGPKINPLGPKINPPVRTVPLLVLPTTAATTISPSREKANDPPRNSTESSSEMLYMVLGIVLGVMMLALIVFMVMCGIKQRQQRRMMAAMTDNVHMKYQDPAQRIYVDTLGKKYMNGGFALNGINGSIPNGHGPAPHHHNHADRKQMNINVNPMSEMELRQRADNPHYNQGNQPVPEPPGGLGMHAPPCSLRASDNNFNSIGSSNKNVSVQNADTGYHSNTDQPGCISGGNPPSHRSSGSRSNESQSSTGSLPDYRHCLALQSNSEEDMFERPRPEQQDVRECCNCSPHRLGDPNLELNCRGPSLRTGLPAEQGRLSGSSSQGSHHQHKRRRKRRTSHEHSTRDQATNTDLSSNEGTMDHPSLTKLPRDNVIIEPQQGESSVANENSSSSSVTSEPQCSSPNGDARVSPYDNTTDGLTDT